MFFMSFISNDLWGNSTKAELALQMGVLILESRDKLLEFVQAKYINYATTSRA